jgi:phosphatidylserine/phosphatidylglycerophosphate/cardiolipin synthase-like enzyme
MIMLDGEAAEVICGLANDRWQAATGEPIPPPPRGAKPWPEHLPPDFRDVTVGLARSIPSWGARRRITEAPRLIADVLKAARRSLYIEAQYLTAKHVADILERRLAEPDGPEVVIVVSDVTHSWLERVIMIANRNRVTRRLGRADRHGRLRVYHPVAPGPNGGCPILVHSKLIIADDRFLRIGSSNLNNRSVGIDSEFEVVIEAQDDADREAIAAVRDRLLGEHLGVEPGQLGRLAGESGSLIAAIEGLNGGARRLQPSRAMHRPGSTQPIFGSTVLDPVEPFSWSRLWASVWPWRRGQP